MNSFTTIDLLRHGEPMGGKKFRGALDDPLSPQGWQQMRTAVGDFRGWEAIISSPLTRCAAFAHELAKHLNRPLEIVQDFSEIRFGIWEGRSVAEVHNNDTLALTQFWRDPVAHPIPEGESVVDFDHRVAQAWLALLERYHGQHVLLIAHGGTIRMVLHRILDMPLQRLWRFEVPFAALSRVHCFHDSDAEPRLVFHNGRVA